MCIFRRRSSHPLSVCQEIRSQDSRLRCSRWFWEARWWKQEARRTFPTQQKHAHAPAARSFPTAVMWNLGSSRTAKLLRVTFDGMTLFQASVVCSQNSSTCSRYWESLRVSYQGMAINITTGARGDRLGPGASQIGSQFPPLDENKHFPHYFSKRGIRKNRWQDTSPAQLRIYLWWMSNPWLALRSEWIVHTSKKVSQ